MGPPSSPSISIGFQARLSFLRILTADLLNARGIIDGIVGDTINILIQQLKLDGPVVDIVEWLRYFIFDTLSRIAFSEDIGLMVNKKDIDDTLAGA